ncbi:MAG: D-sedoheptulose 7-phosphate isomerase [Bacteroidetes bacterium]|jgi:D-sedoheptulose 7-phosphate isomerase|nr:D-sedoheptulose 7-phosphate isomerase [Bacteroidota bacterium]
MASDIKALIRASIDTKELVAKDQQLIDDIQKSVTMIVNALKTGNKILFCGNGGSAADAQHIAAELSGRFYTDRDPLYAEALHVNSSYMTAVANDYSFDVVYSRMIKGCGRKGDVLVGISTSGNSKNVILALEEARKLGMHTIGMTGAGGGKMQGTCDLMLMVPSKDTPRIQESHILIGHIICQLIEEELFEKK